MTARLMHARRLTVLLSIVFLGLPMACRSSPETRPPETPMPSEGEGNGWSAPQPSPEEQFGAGPQSGSESGSGSVDSPGTTAEPAGPQATGAAGPANTDVETFARAYIDVASIQEQYSAKLQSVSEQEAQEIQQRAQQEMVQAIEQHGMSVPQFEQMSQAVGTDEQLRAQFEQKFQELNQESQQ